MKKLQLLLLVFVLLTVACVKSHPTPDPGAPTIIQTNRVAGAMNDTLRIYGSGFGTAADQDKVTINGVNAPLISLNAAGTEIDVKVPPRAFSGYIVVTANGRPVQGPKFTYLVTTGIVSTFAGNGTAGFADGQGKSAEFNLPWALAMDSLGYLYVSDENNFRIRRIHIADSTVSTIAGTGNIGHQDGAGQNATFAFVNGIAVNGTKVYVSDVDNETIRVMDNAGTNVQTIAGTLLYPGYVDGPAGSAKFYTPGAMSFDNAGNLLIVDEGNEKIRKLDIGQGQVSTYLDLSKTFYSPAGIAYNPADGDVFISDDQKHQVYDFNSGSLYTLFGTNGVAGYQDGIKGAAVKFNTPEGLAFDENYDVFVADAYNHCIRMIDNQWNVITIAGNPSAPGLADGAGKAAKFYYPASVVVDKVNHYLYVTDSANNTVRKVILE